MKPVDAAPLTESQAQRRSASSRLAAAHPWLAHLVLTVVLLLLGLVTAGLAAETVAGASHLGLYPADTPAALVVPLGWVVGAVLGATVLCLRGRWPLATVAALTLVSVVGLATTGVLGVLGACLAVAVRGVAARRGARWGWLTAGPVLVVVTAAVMRWEDVGLGEILLWSNVTPTPDSAPVLNLTEPVPSAGRRYWTVLLLFVLLLLGGVTGSEAWARRLHAQDLVARYAALARERDAGAEAARAAERDRIAREMHDIVAHSVSVMVALSDGASSAMDRAPDASRAALAELSRTGREALQDMRGVLGSSHPVEPTEVDLRGLVERFRAAGLAVRTEGPLDVLPAETAVRLAVVRIVGEALTNVLRHAPGAVDVQVRLRRDDSDLEVEILDSGGTRAGTGGGSGRGLVGVRERAAHVGGHVVAGPRPTGGWRVHVVLPVGTEEKEDA